MPILEITLLGGFHARIGGESTVSFPTRKAQALLAFLAMSPGERHAREKLASLLWGDTGDEQARTSLRQSLFLLKRALGSGLPDCLVADSRVVSLRGDGVDVDALAFLRLVAQGTESSLEQAAALYRGDLLEGLTIREAAFDDWLLSEQTRLRDTAIRVLERLLALQRDGSDPERCIQTARRLLHLDPLNEDVHRAEFLTRRPLHLLYLFFLCYIRLKDHSLCALFFHLL